jgi:hypothetical protein
MLKETLWCKIEGGGNFVVRWQEIINYWSRRKEGIDAKKKSWKS